MTPNVALITLNWKQPDATLECLASAAAQTHPNTHLIVVDNGSNDGSVERIAAAYPQATVIDTGANLGFAAGMNVGMRHALDHGADYVFVLNNDTVFPPDMLTALLAHTAPDVGVVIPTIYYADVPDRPWSLGGTRNWLTLEKQGDTPAALVAARATGVLERDYVPGCAILLSRSLLEQVGLFDECFFMYYEDMDFCLRVRQAGFRILLVATAAMWHKVAVSSGGSDSPNERYWMAQSSVLFFRKHVAGLRWLAVVPFRTGSAIKTVTRLYLRGRRKAAHAYLAGLRDGIKATPCE